MDTGGFIRKLFARACFVLKKRPHSGRTGIQRGSWVKVSWADNLAPGVQVDTPGPDNELLFSRDLSSTGARFSELLNL